MSELIDIVLAEDTEGTSARLERWLVKPGDAVAVDAPLAEIETDKVTLEIPAPAAGIFHQALVAPGTEIAPGALLGRIDPALPGETEPDRRAPAAAKSESPHRHRQEKAEERISPAVRRLMSERGLKSLDGISGSGEDGRVRRDDLLAWLGERPAGDGATPPVPGLTGKRVAHSNMRRSIARHMARSLSQAPHVTSVFEADMGAVVRHRRRQREAFAEQGTKLTYSAYFLAASARAMAVVPQVNARYHEDALEIFEEVNIGVGTALGDEGLIVPVVHGVEQLDLLAIARELKDKSSRARAGALTPADLGGGTFTISNHGVSGSLLAAPIIINQPQVAILGIGKLEKRVQVAEADGEDKVRVRPMCYVSLSIDHRALDAHQTNRWLSAFVETLQNWPLD